MHCDVYLYFQTEKLLAYRPNDVNKFKHNKTVINSCRKFYLQQVITKGYRHVNINCVLAFHNKFNRYHNTVQINYFPFINILASFLLTNTDCKIKSSTLTIQQQQQQQQQFTCIPIYIDGIAQKKEISKNK